MRGGGGGEVGRVAFPCCRIIQLERVRFALMLPAAITTGIAAVAAVARFTLDVARWLAKADSPLLLHPLSCCTLLMCVCV